MRHSRVRSPGRFPVSLGPRPSQCPPVWLLPSSSLTVTSGKSVACRRAGNQPPSRCARALLAALPPPRSLQPSEAEALRPPPSALRQGFSVFSATCVGCSAGQAG